VKFKLNDKQGDSQQRVGKVHFV